MNQRQFERRPSKPTANPRKVVGGVKLTSRRAGAGAGGAPAETPWVFQRWMRLVETYAPGEQLAEGLEYARLGQARTLDMTAGVITSRVQGRMPKAYNVSIRLPVFTAAHWPPVIEAMIAQARYAAALLSGEVPSNIEDLFIPVGLKLFPSEPSDVAVSCDCPIFTGKWDAYDIPQIAPPTAAPGSAPPPDIPAPALTRPVGPMGPGGHRPSLPPGVPWCKHACCVMALVADRLASDPFMIFSLRGLPPDELIDRLRQRRQAVGGSRPTGVASLVYESHLPGVSDRSSKPLEQCAETFWTGEGSIDDLDLTIGPPEVSHPLLRRMGPSPFAKAKFPIVGLLATCYDLVSRDAIGEHAAGGSVDGDPASAEGDEA